jgi:hypothetical protein
MQTTSELVEERSMSILMLEPGFSHFGGPQL